WSTRMTPTRRSPRSAATRWKWCRISTFIAGWPRNRRWLPPRRPGAGIDDAQRHIGDVPGCRVHVRHALRSAGAGGHPDAECAGRERCAPAIHCVVQPFFRAATHARAVAGPVGPDETRAPTSPRAERRTLGDAATRAPATNPRTPGALGRDDPRATPPAARERARLPQLDARRTRQGQRSVPQIPVAVPRRTPRAARTLARDAAATAHALGGTARRRIDSDASASVQRALSMRSATFVSRAGRRHLRQ